MMTYDEFLAKARADADRNDVPYGAKIPKDVFAVSWKSAGAEGGSCWGESAYPITPEREPDFAHLMEFLDDFDIRLREANAILKHVVETDHSESGYYGNWARYTVKYIPISKLHELMAGFGYVEAAPVEAPVP